MYILVFDMVMSFKPGQQVLIKPGARQQFLCSNGTFTPFDESVRGAPEMAYLEWGGHTAEVVESFPEQSDDLIHVLIRGRTRQVEKTTAFYRLEDLVCI